jgi:hypothetical protein
MFDLEARWHGNERDKIQLYSHDRRSRPGIRSIHRKRELSGKTGWHGCHDPVVSRLDLLRWQFELTWSLLELHLAELRAEDFLWEPAEHCWTVRPDGGPGRDGRWLPDWDEAELSPIPVPTIGWVTWHIGWWWSVTLDHAYGRPVRAREEITWPADGTVEWLRGLRSEWLAVLGTLDLDAPAPFPWQNDPSMTVAHMVAWVNAELMKNSAELGQLRLLRAAG